MHCKQQNALPHMSASPCAEKARVESQVMGGLPGCVGVLCHGEWPFC